MQAFGRMFQCEGGQGPMEGWFPPTFWKRSFMILKKADDDCEKEHCEKSFELTDGKKMTWNCVSAVVKWPLKK